MAKAIYAGVNNVAKKVKKVYVGVDGIARKVKKAYVGVNGVAKLCYTLGKGTVAAKTSFDSVKQRCRAAAARVGNYAIFLGGDNGEDTITASKAVEAYDSSLTETTMNDLPQGLTYVAATSLGNHALFFGGQTTETSGSSDCLAYDETLTATTIPYIWFTPTSNAAATTLGNYAICSGGKRRSAIYDPAFGNPIPCSNEVVVIDESLTRVTQSLSLRDKLENQDATTLGDYAIFVGGNDENNGRSSEAYVINSDLVEITRIPLDMETQTEMAATTVGNYALFGLGSIGQEGSIFINGLTSDLVQITPINDYQISGVQRRFVAAETLGDYALFAGGNVGYDTNQHTTVVTAYDSDLVNVELNSGLYVYARSRMASACVGSYALFNGGKLTNGVTGRIDCYELTY